MEAMLEAETVAVVGASARDGSFGERMMLELIEGGFEGRILPVNPRYPEILGHTCYESVAAVPEPIDLAILGLPNALLEEQLSAAAAAGARSAVIFASGHEEPREGVPPLTSRLASIAREAGMALCGGNGMGFLNLERRLRACGFSEPNDLPPGAVTFISHSGSAFSALLHNDRNLRFNLVVSAGQEFVTTMADYLEYALGLESTRVVGLFLETVRDAGGVPERPAPGERARRPGRGPEGGRGRAARRIWWRPTRAPWPARTARTRPCSTPTASCVSRRWTRWLDTLTLLSAGRRAGPGAWPRSTTPAASGPMIIDLAARAGVPFAEISEATRQRLEAVLEPGLPPVNPLDAWGTGNAADDIYVECIRALLADDAVRRAGLLRWISRPRTIPRRATSRRPRRSGPRRTSRWRCSATWRARWTGGTSFVWPRPASRSWRERTPGWPRSGTFSRTATFGLARRCRPAPPTRRSPRTCRRAGANGSPPRTRSASPRAWRCCRTTVCR